MMDDRLESHRQHEQPEQRLESVDLELPQLVEAFVLLPVFDRDERLHEVVAVDEGVAD
jgi:hypothetical protein